MGFGLVPAYLLCILFLLFLFLIILFSCNGIAEMSSCIVMPKMKTLYKKKQRIRVFYDTPDKHSWERILKGRLQYFKLFFFQLYNAHSSSQESQKQHFVMLLPSLGNKQHKMNKNIFEKGHVFFFQKIYKNKGPYFCFLFFCFNFLLIKKIISYFFHVYCRLIFDPGGK